MLGHNIELEFTIIMRISVYLLRDPAMNSRRKSMPLSRRKLKLHQYGIGRKTIISNTWQKVDNALEPAI